MDGGGEEDPLLISLHNNSRRSVTTRLSSWSRFATKPWRTMISLPGLQVPTWLIRPGLAVGGGSLASTWSTCADTVHVTVGGGSVKVNRDSEGLHIYPCGMRPTTYGGDKDQEGWVEDVAGVVTGVLQL